MIKLLNFAIIGRSKLVTMFALVFCISIANILITFSIKKSFNGDYTSIHLLVLKLGLSFLALDLSTYKLFNFRGELYSNVYNHYLNLLLEKLPLQKIAENIEFGKINNHINSDVKIIATFSADAWRTIFPTIFLFFSIFIYLFYFYKWHTFLLLSILAPGIILSHIIGKSIKGFQHKNQGNIDSYNSLTHDIISNIDTILLNNFFKYYRLEIQKKIQDCTKSSFLLSLVMISMYTISFCCWVAPPVILAIIFKTGLIKGGLTEYFELVWLLQISNQFLMGIPTTISVYNQSKIANQRLLETIHSFEVPSPQTPKLKGIDDFLENIYHSKNLLILNANPQKIKSILQKITANYGIENFSFARKNTPILQSCDLRNIYFMKKRNIQRIHQILDALNLSKFKTYSIENLSGGESARLGIARTMYTPFKYNIIENSFTSLDDTLKKNVLNNLLDYVNQEKIIIFHNGSVDFAEKNPRIQIIDASEVN